MTPEQWNAFIAQLMKWGLIVLAAGGGGAAVAYRIFKTLGEKWLDQHFQKRLQELKHAQERDIELLKHQINSLFSRVSKIHEKEFEVLPKAWLMLNDLYGRVMLALDLTMKLYPDFSRMSEEWFEQFLRSSDCKLSDYQKQELRKREPDKRSNYFSEAMAGVYLEDAQEKMRVFKNYLIEYSIFMTEELRQKFNDAHSTFADAFYKYSAGRRGGNWEIEHQGQKAMLDENLKKMISDVETEVQKRLHYHAA